MEIDIIEPDHYYHIYNRGINRQKIFVDYSHYYWFLYLCKEYLLKHADILSYCLIPNHFHFLVYIHAQGTWYNEPAGNNPFSNYFNAYAQWFNVKTERCGGLFQRPFKRKRILTQEYLKRVVYYIHRNPLHHKLTTDPTKYKFSSYQDIIGNNPTFINRDHVFQWFDGPSHFADFHKMNFEIEEDEFFNEFFDED